MPDPSFAASELPTKAWALLEPILDHFEKAWAQGPTPRIADFLVANPSLDHSLLLKELVIIDLEYRLKGGETVRVEDYLERFPQLAETPAAVFALIQREIKACGQNQGTTTLAEYLRRFPQYEQQLRESWPFHGETPAISQENSTEKKLTPRPGQEVPPWPTIPGYEIQGELGHGGMGIVYKAWQTALKRLVALKMIRAAQADPEEIHRFRQEAEAVAQLQHPHIIHIFEVGEHQGAPFLVMEFLAGGPLSKQINGTPQSPRQAAALTETLARAVDYAHQRGIIHRDLKPGNILLAADDTPRIADFGLAKRLDDAAGLTQTGRLLGTPSYMAPEQAHGKKNVGAAADVYALGAMLYELLTGRPPFVAPTSLEVVLQVRHDEPPPLSQLGPNVPRDLDTICLKCLRKEPERRYATALALADDLGRFLRHEPIQARPVGRWERTVKWVRRRPTAASLILVCLLALLGFGLGGIYHYFQLRKALEKANSLLYVADMRLGHQSWRKGDIRPLLASLERHGPDSSWPATAHFEWGFLQHLAKRREVPTYKAHQGPTTHAVYSPDGATLATGGDDGLIHLWDSVTRQKRTWVGHKGAVSCMAFRPDGQVLVSTGKDQTVRQWDVASGKEQSSWVPDTKAKAPMVLSPDGRFLAATLGEKNNTIKVWEVASKKLLQARSFPPSEPLGFPLAFSRQGRLLAIGIHDTVHLWDLNAAKDHRVLYPYVGLCGAFSHHDAWLALGTTDGTVHLVDTGLVRFPGGIQHEDIPLRGHVGGVRAVAFTPNDDALISAGSDATIRFWDLGERRQRALVQGHLAQVKTLACSPRDQTLAAGDDDGTLKLWPTRPGPDYQPLVPDFLATGPVAFSSDSKTVAVVGADNTVILVDAATGQRQRTLPGHPRQIMRLAFAPRGGLLATIGLDKTARLWDPTTGSEHRRLALDHFPAGLAFSADGQTLAVGFHQGHVQLWHTTGWQTGFKITVGSEPIWDLAFAPNSKELFTCHANRVDSWDVQTGKNRGLGLESGGPIRRLAVSPDGQFLATSPPQAGELILWELATKKRVLQINDARSAVAFSPNSQDLALIKKDGFQFVGIKTKLPFASGGWTWGVDILDLALAPNGKAVAVTSADGIIKLWNTETWQPRKPSGLNPATIFALAFAEDGRTLITGSKAERPVKFRTWDRGFVGETTGILGMFLKRDPSKRDANYDLDASDKELLCWWDTASGATLPGPPRDQKAPGITCLARGPQGVLWAGGGGGAIWKWNLANKKVQPPLFIHEEAEAYWGMIETGQKIWSKISPEYKDAAVALAASADGRWLASACNRGSVQIWDAVKDKLVRTLPKTHQNLACLAFSPNGNTLAVNDQGDVQFWEISKGEAKDRLAGSTEPMLAMAYAPDGQTLAMGFKNHRLVLRNLKTLDEKILFGPTDAVSAVAFSPDGRLLASGSWDGTVRLWHMPSFQELFALEGSMNQVHAVLFSPDGRTLAAGGEGKNGVGVVNLWHAAPPP